ncbi:hypothetical protein DW352_14535 [Pseudolabrys taiwanensis]|uniref:Lipoprotein n=1 Tax=Pseudolabrys taiwanensis TaxID=331696 RepID=A0A345ZXI0_9HYPH|nr:hypothetical protein [Pseudolabrys taiwanensis]AXK81627.1 hypothetical protein DW352_14535 [Pseudolabrys taiwanensis]
MGTTGLRAVAFAGVALALGACGSTSTSSLLSGSPLDLFSSSSKATKTDTAASGTETVSASDIECPEMKVRTGASTLMVGSKPGDGEPAALDVRYQGTIIRMARECNVHAGMMTMKVGIEGRIITGPAGAPGTVDVPLRIAVVQEGLTPKPIVSKFAREQVTISSAVDRVTFTHIDNDLTFPLPQPLGLIDSFVVYVGFDPLGAKPEPRRPARRKPKQS